MQTAAGLGNPTVVGADRKVLPSDSSLSLQYTFYTKITALGGSSAFFGPYTFEVGCLAGSVSFTDSANTDVTILVGASTTGVFTFVAPTPSPTSFSWCIPLTNEIVNPDATGTPWTPPIKINACAPQPCLTYDIVSSVLEDVISFKILSTMPGALTKLSPLRKITIVCGNAYALSEVAAPSNPQLINFGDATLGFNLPVYQTS